MRNNLWNKKRRQDGLWFNQSGGMSTPPGGGGGAVIGNYSTGGSGSSNLNLTPNPPVTTNPNISNGLTSGSVPGTGTSCGCSYDMNCWDANDPSTLSNYPGQPTADCPTGTSLSEPNNSYTTTSYSGTCYNSACPGNGASYNTLPSNNCPPGTQLTQPTCTMNNCYTGGCNANGTAVVAINGPYYNGNCPTGTTSSQPICGGSGSGGGLNTGGSGGSGGAAGAGGNAGFSS